MHSSILWRRLGTTATAVLPSRAIATLSPLTAPSPWMNQRLTTRSNLPINTRSFSHTTTLSSSSPFRFSSNKNTNPNPNTKPHDNANDNDAYEPYCNEEEDHLSRYTPYRPKRQWPPDMTKLSPKHQFRLERKYRRRAALKFARPKWTKGTKLVQWGIIGFTLVYALLFMQWDDKGSPFDELRQAFFTGIKAVFSAPPPSGPVNKTDQEQ